MMIQLPLSEISLDSLHILVVIGMVCKELDDVVDVLGIVLYVCSDFLVSEEILRKLLHVEMKSFGSRHHLVLVHLLFVLISYIEDIEHPQLIIDKTIENIRDHSYQTSVDLQPLDNLLLLCVRDNTPQREGSLQVFCCNFFVFHYASLLIVPYTVVFP